MTGAMDGLLAAMALTFAASVHCVGMCGGLVLAAGAGANTRRAHVGRQALLQTGKASTYVFLGVLAGALGGAVARSPFLTWGGRALAIVSGLALGVAGLMLLGLLGGASSAVVKVVGPLWERVVKPLVSSRPAGFPLVVGMVMGLLPCPLVYAGLGAAAAAGTPLAGALVMAGVALGTAPALALSAAFGVTLPATWRRGAARFAGVLLLAVAAVTLLRGVGLHAGHGGHPAAHQGPSAPAEHQHQH